MPLLPQTLGELILEKAQDNAKFVDFKQANFSGHLRPSLTRRVFSQIDRLLKKHAYGKIGKTVQPESRLHGKDYQSYHTLYILYSTTSRKYISDYETLCIQQFASRLENQHPYSNGRESSVRKRYYLYLAVGDSA